LLEFSIENYLPRGIKLVLGFSNPVDILFGLLNLFVSRPFGAKSLLQRFCGILVDMSTTKAKLKEAKWVLGNADIEQKIDEWIKLHYSPTKPPVPQDQIPFELVQLVLTDPATKPKFDPNILNL
jgi:hypothetical protein